MMVLRRQLEHLLEVEQLRHVEIQVMPTFRGDHPGGGRLQVLKFDDGTAVGRADDEFSGRPVTDPRPTAGGDMNRRDTSGHLADLTWFKSSYSDTSNPSDCVEVAITLATVHVRDSKCLDGPRLAVTRAAWTGFVDSAATAPAGTCAGRMP